MSDKGRSGACVGLAQNQPGSGRSAVLALRVAGSTRALFVAAGLYLAAAVLAPAADRTIT